MAGQCFGVAPGDHALRKLIGSTREGRKEERLEAGRMAFERAWGDWNFDVRCFREGRGEGVGFVSILYFGVTLLKG